MGCIFSAANRLKGTSMYKERGMKRVLKTKEVCKVAVIYSNYSTLINPLSVNYTERPNTLK